jgi:hypothetical protein
MTDLLSRWAANIRAAGSMSSLDDIDPCLVDDAPVSDHAESVGCAFGGGKSADTKPIPLDQCVKECQKVSAEFHAAMKRLGVESE